MSRDAARVGAGISGAAALWALAFGALGACQPTVRVVAPDEPIVINVNVHIDQEIRIKMDPEIDALIANNPDLF